MVKPQHEPLPMMGETLDQWSTFPAVASSPKLRVCQWVTQEVTKDLRTTLKNSVSSEVMIQPYERGKGEFKEKTSADQKEHVGWSHIVHKHLDEPQVWTDETKTFWKVQVSVFGVKLTQPLIKGKVLVLGVCLVCFANTDGIRKSAEILKATVRLSDGPSKSTWPKMTWNAGR